MSSGKPASELVTVPTGTPAPSRSWLRVLVPLVFVTAPVLALDQSTKLYVKSHFHLYQSRPIVPHWLDLMYTLNPGAAFSLFATMGPEFRHIFFIALSIFATVVLLALMMSRTTATSWSIAFALILAGTIGNLIDRLARGLVIDFIYFHHASFRYPVFNIADSAITVGVILILILSWLEPSATSSH